MIKCSECQCLVNGFCHRFAPIPYYEYFDVHCKAPDQKMYGHVVWPKIRNPNEDGCGEGVEELECFKKLREAQERLRDTK